MGTVTRRAFLAGAVLLTAPLAAKAQHGSKPHRIGWLGVPHREAAEHNVRALEQGLRELGWVRGRNLIIDYRWAEGEYNRLGLLATELVRLEPRVIVAGPMAAVRAAKAATSTVPIVMVTVTDPIGEGLIANFAKPGGNVTGLTLTPTWEIYAKQFELLKEAIPHASRIAFLWSPANVAAPPAVRTVQEAALRLGLELDVIGTRRAEEFEQAFRAMVDARAQGLLVLADGMFFAHRARLANLALVHRLPTMFASKEYTDAGGLISYGTSYPALYRRAAIYVDRNLRGAKPGELSVEQARTFELVVNLKTAKALGLTIPPSLLARTDQVIE